MHSHLSGGKGAPARPRDESCQTTLSTEQLTIKRVEIATKASLMARSLVKASLAACSRMSAHAVVTSYSNR